MCIVQPFVTFFPFLLGCCPRLLIKEMQGNEKYFKEVIAEDDCFNGRPVWSGKKSIFHDGSKWNIGHVDKSQIDYTSTTNLTIKCPQYVGDSWAAVGKFTIDNGWNVYNVSCIGEHFSKKFNFPLNTKCDLSIPRH